MPDDRALLDAVPDGVIIHDAEGTILDVNRRVPEYLGYEKAALVGATVWDIAADPNPPAVKARWAGLEPGDITAIDGEHVRADGSSFPVRVHVSRLETDGEPTFLATARDISARLERERELERQNERLDQFASLVSHDLRSPLSVVDGRLELALETGDPDHLDPASKAIDRMEALIADLLTLAREGDRATQPEPVALDSIWAAAWESVETPSATAHVETERTVTADRGRLRQLLENLLRNAVEHGGPDVTVRIGDLEDGFFVEDDGRGVPAADRAAVFEIGYSTPAEGTGLGLVIVRDIAETHAWDVRLTAGEAGGARFEFTGVDVAG